MNKKITSLVFIAVIYVCLVPTVAYADAGLPMLAIVWPLSWFAFIPIVAIETVVAKILVLLPWRKSIIASLSANAGSTLIGIPITWALLCVSDIVLSQGGRAFGLKTLFWKIYAVTVQSAWLIPYEEDFYWMIPAAVAFMLPFYGLVSVFIERSIFRKIAGCNEAIANNWSWKANLITYGISTLSALIWLIVNLLIGK